MEKKLKSQKSSLYHFTNAAFKMMSRDASIILLTNEFKKQTLSNWKVISIVTFNKRIFISKGFGVDERIGSREINGECLQLTSRYEHNT